jgi:hypothetical protein
MWRLNDDLLVIVGNVSGEDGEGLVQIPGLGGADAWLFHDRAGGETYRRTHDDLARGLFVWLAAGRAHMFVVKRDNP